jgi:hypothetical protein
MSFFGEPGTTEVHQAPGTRPPGFRFADQFLNGLSSLGGQAFPGYQGQIDPGLSPTLQDTIRRAQGYAQSGPSESLQGAMGSLGRFMNPSFSNINNVLAQGVPQFFPVNPNQRLYDNNTVGESGWLGSDPTRGSMYQYPPQSGVEKLPSMTKPLQRPQQLDFTTGGPQAQGGYNPFAGGAQVVSSNDPGQGGGMVGVGGQSDPLKDPNHPLFGGDPFASRPYTGAAVGRRMPPGPSGAASGQWTPGGGGSSFGSGFSRPMGPMAPMTGGGLGAPKPYPGNPFGGQTNGGIPAGGSQPGVMPFGSASVGYGKPNPALFSRPSYGSPGGMGNANGGGLQAPISPPGFPVGNGHVQTPYNPNPPTASGRPPGGGMTLPGGQWGPGLVAGNDAMKSAASAQQSPIAALMAMLAGGGQPQLGGMPQVSDQLPNGQAPFYSAPAQGVKTAWDMGQGANRGQVRQNPQTGQQEILMGAGGGEQYQWMPFNPNDYGHQQNAQMFQRYGQNWTSGSGATSFHSPDIAQILREKTGREPTWQETNDYYYGVRPMSELGY